VMCSCWHAACRILYPVLHFRISCSLQSYCANA
jgi:hypothetical protein